jgi:hypothetical protein
MRVDRPDACVPSPDNRQTSTVAARRRRLADRKLLRHAGSPDTVTVKY